MKGIVAVLNKFPLYGLESMAGEKSTLRYCIENGKITDFFKEKNEEIPTQTANPSGDK